MCIIIAKMYMLIVEMLISGKTLAAYQFLMVNIPGDQTQIPVQVINSRKNQLTLKACFFFFASSNLLGNNPCTINQAASKQSFKKLYKNTWLHTHILIKRLLSIVYLNMFFLFAASFH